MKAQIVEQVELFSEAELESLEFVPEELEAIEAERVPDLDSISFEEVAKELEAYLEGGVEGVRLESGNPQLPNEILWRMLQHSTIARLRRRIQSAQNAILRFQRDLQNATSNNQINRAAMIRNQINGLHTLKTQLQQEINSIRQRLRNSG